MPFGLAEGWMVNGSARRYPWLMSSSPRPLILILEDDQSAAAALAMLLDDWGYETIGGTAPQDLDRALEGREGEVRAIITDYHLNGCTGPQAIAGLRARGVEGRVLMMTGTLRGKARLDAKSAGHQFLEKPVAVGDLLDWLGKTALTA